MKAKSANILVKFIKISLLVFLIFANISVVLALDPPPSNPTTAGYGSFPLNVLTLDNGSNSGGLVKGSQGLSYFAANSQAVASTNPLASFIIQIINFIIVTSGSLCFFAVVVGGFLMMSSAGNENQVNKGKDIITRALVGLAISLSAYFIVAFVQSLVFETAPK